MVRKVSNKVLGVDLPLNKCIAFSLAYIRGVGVPSANKICEACGVPKTLRTSDLTSEQMNTISEYIRKNYVVEEDLRDRVFRNIKLLISIGCYRGVRHRLHLPVRGQRTHSNARICKRMLSIKR